MQINRHYTQLLVMSGPLLGSVFPHPAMYITSPSKEFLYINSKVGKQIGDTNSETNKITNIKLALFTVVRSV